MGHIYQKSGSVSSEMTLILEPTQSFVRQFSLGTWDELRMGMFFSCLTGSGPTSDNTTVATDSQPRVIREDIAITGDNNRQKVMFGLKDSSSLAPGTVGTLFVGVATTGSSRLGDNTSVVPYHIAIGSITTATLGSIGYSGSTKIGGITETVGGNSGIMAPWQGGNPVEDPGAISYYCGFYGLRFVINNPGAAGQTMDVWSMRPTQGTQPGSDYSTDNLKTQLDLLPVSASLTRLNWNNGSVAYPIPDSFYVYFPFTKSKTRLSAIYVAKYTFNPSPAGSWKAENNGTDSTGGGALAVLSGSYTTGRISQSFNLAGGTTSGVYVSGQSSSIWVSGSSMSAAAWVRWAGGSGPDIDPFIRKTYSSVGLAGNSAPYECWTLGCSINTGYPNFNIQGVGTISSSIALPPKATPDWAHVCGTYDGSFMKLYLNGALVVSGSATGSITTSTGSLVFGHDGSGGNSLIGRIDEIKLWKTALTADQVLAVYNLVT